MFKALTGTTKYLVIGGVVLVLILGVGLLIYFSGKSAGKKKSTLNLSSGAGAGGEAPTISESEVRTLAQKLFSDMEGANFWGHNADAWNSFLSLSDTDVTRVYNEFNSKYQKETSQSLVQWVESETTTGLDSWDSIKPIVQQRFAKLKLI